MMQKKKYLTIRQCPPYKASRFKEQKVDDLIKFVEDKGVTDDWKNYFPEQCTREEKPKWVNVDFVYTVN